MKVKIKYQLNGNHIYLNFFFALKNQSFINVGRLICLPSEFEEFKKDLPKGWLIEELEND